MRKYLIPFFAFLATITIHAQPITTISYGPRVTVLSTSSTGAVTGTAFAIPAGNASVWSVQVTADGSALSVNIQASIDNSSWTTLSNCVTAAGCLYNSGIVGYTFLRVNAVSRTGGTSTTATVVTSRAYSTSVSGGAATLTGNLLFSPDATWTIGLVSASRPLDVFVSSRVLAGSTVQAGGSAGIQWAARSVMSSSANGLWTVTNAATTLGLELNALGPPTLTSCGTGSVSAGSKNSAGGFIATGATSCVVNFSLAFTQAPFCIITNQTANRGVITSTSTGTMTVGSLTAGDQVMYICIGRVV